MAGFLMGAAGSARRVNAEQYNSMASVLSPDSRARIPDTDTALALLQDFEALSLGEGSGGAFCSASHSCLSFSVLARRCASLIVVCDWRLAIGKGRDTN